MAFFYDRITNQSGISQYLNYLDNQLYLYELRRDVKDITNYQLIEVRRAIANNSIQQQNSINNAVKNVCGSLEMGFNKVLDEFRDSNRYLGNIEQGIDDINWQMINLSSKLDDLIYLFDDKLNLILEQQKTTNELLSTIAIGVYLPDRKKENIYYTKQGNKFLKAAVTEGPNSSYYEKALSDLQRAYQYDCDESITLKQLGFIYLNSRKHLDIPKAEYYFLESALNAVAFSNDFAGVELTDTAASSYYLASVCNYILGDLVTAIKYIKLGLTITPDRQKYRFQLAKYYAASGNYSEDLITNLLRDILEHDKLFSIEILKDQDLITKKSVRDMLESETNRLVQLVDTKILNIKRIMIANSPFYAQINEIERNFYPKTYLNARIAKEKLGPNDRY